MVLMQLNMYDFLKGGGEMGQRMREYDWNKTAVGTPNEWPKSLQITVSLLLHSKFPMFLMWGPDYIQFYNDAYIPAFQGDPRHATALGQKYRECWKDAWESVKPMLEQVRLGGEAIWQEDCLVPLSRNGQMEDSFWTFSYSPVMDDSWNVGGVLATCMETTQKIESIRKLEESKDELLFAIDSTELGTWDLNPDTGRFTANARLKEWFGLRPEEEIPLAHAVANIAQEDRERVAAEIKTALQFESGGQYETAYQIKNPLTGRVRVVLAKGRAWFGDDQKAYRFNGTLRDVTEESRVEESKRLSRQQLLQSFEQAPVGIATIELNALTFTMANNFYGDLVGRKPEALIGKPLLEALPELKGQGFEDLLQKVIETGAPYISKEVSVDLMRKGQLETIYVDLVYQPQKDLDQQTTGILVVATDVTQQVTSRRNIEESEARFRSLIEQAPVATCLFVGPEMRVEIANDLMLGYWGKDQSILELPLSQALPELADQPFPKLLDKVYRTGQSHSEIGAKAELVVNGIRSTYYFDYTYKPLRNISGEVYAVMNMAIDVTEQVISRQKLEESERFSRHIFYNSPVAKLVYTGPDMVLQEANQAMFDILGRDESILNKPLVDAIPELKNSTIFQNYQHVFTTGESCYEYEQRILIVKDGVQSWGYYDFIFKALRNADNEIYGVVCTAMEVTKSFLAREQIEAVEASLRSAIELAELATWSVDLLTGQVDYSDRLKEWLGVGQADLELRYSPRIHEKDRERVGKAMLASMEADGDGLFDQIYTIIHKVTNQERIIHSSGKVVFDEQRKPVSISGVAQDVTLQQQVQQMLEAEVLQRTEELSTSNEELRRSNDELSQYAYVASHDLQEPLRKIRIFSGMLLGREDNSEQGRNYIEKISQAAERMSLLIKDLLEFSKLTNAEQNFRPTDLNLVVESVELDFELLIGEKQARINTTKLPVIEAMPLQMNQLFYNLISNALKFVRPGTRPQINIGCKKASKELVLQHIRNPNLNRKYYHITVQDNGIGFDSTHFEQIFEVFKRLNAQDIYPGSGIGLSLCRRIVGNHDGMLYAESQIGMGSTFHMLLPA